MKKLQQVVGVLFLLGVSVMVSGPGASAASTCPNGYTGPNSENICTSVTTYQCEQINDNTVTINQDNTQVAVSGDTASEGNGGAGGAQTGSATNSNGVTYNVSVTNQGVCTAIATTKATPTPEVKTPATPGKGAVAAPKNVTKPAALATTSGSPVVNIITGSLLALAVIVGVARLVTLVAANRK